MYFLAVCFFALVDAGNVAQLRMTEYNIIINYEQFKPFDQLFLCSSFSK